MLSSSLTNFVMAQLANEPVRLSMPAEPHFRGLAGFPLMPV
jgi:hypothetical protein